MDKGPQRGTMPEESKRGSLPGTNSVGLPVIQTALYCHVSCGKLGNSRHKKRGWSFNRGISVITRFNLVVSAYYEGGRHGRDLERFLVTDTRDGALTA